MRRHVINVGPDLDGQRLDKAIAAASPLSRVLARRVIAAGGVFVAGRRVLVASKAVRDGQVLEVHVEEGSRVAAAPVEMSTGLSATVLYEDEDVIAVDKPPGIAAQSTLTSAEALPELVSKLTEQPALLVHRLDLDTSGVTILGRHKRAVSNLTRAFRDGAVSKTYLAIAKGRPLHPGLALHSKGVFDWPLVQDQAARGRWKAVASGRGTPSVTRWEIIEQFAQDLLEGGASSIRLHPETGRTHQIRAHLSFANAPILGDKRYGGPTFITFADGRRLEIPRMLLHARRLVIPHPRSGEPLDIEAPIPVDMLDVAEALGGRVDLIR